MQELPAVVAAVGHAGAIEGRVRSIQLFFCITLHEQVNGHDTCPLFEQEGRGCEGEGPAVVIVEELFGLSGSIHHFIVDTGNVQDQPHHQTQTRQDEEYPGYEGEDGALWSYVSDVADDEGCEDKQQRDHRERGRRPHHFEDVGCVFCCDLYLWLGEILRGDTPALLRSCHKADSPQSRVQRHLDLCCLVLLQDDTLLHQQPVVGRHGDAHQQQAAGPKYGGQQCERSRAERTHPAEWRRPARMLQPRSGEATKLAVFPLCFSLLRMFLLLLLRHLPLLFQHCGGSLQWASL